MPSGQGHRNSTSEKQKKLTNGEPNLLSSKSKNYFPPSGVGNKIFDKTNRNFIVRMPKSLISRYFSCIFPPKWYFGRIKSSFDGTNRKNIAQGPSFKNSYSLIFCPKFFL